MTGNVAVGQLQRMRVLVATRDQAFRTSASAVLSRHGYLVESTDRSSRIPELIGRTRPNVVVVDASQSPRAVAHVLAVMASTRERIGLLVVAGESVPDWAERLAPVRKLSLGETLPAEVERAYAESHREGRAIAALS